MSNRQKLRRVRAVELRDPTSKQIARRELRAWDRWVLAVETLPRPAKHVGSSKHAARKARKLAARTEAQA